MKLAKTLFAPYIKRFWPMLLSVVLVGAFGCGVLIGLRNAYHSLQTNVSSLLEECGYPDLYVETTEGIEESYLDALPDDFNDYMGIERAEYRASCTTTCDSVSGSFSCRLIGYSQESVLSWHVVEGFLNDEDAYLDYYFAVSNNVRLGDTLMAKLPDGGLYEFRVGALVVSPETSVVKADPYSISSSRDFAYLYVPKPIIVDAMDKPAFNQMLFFFEEGKQKTLDETLDALKAYVKEKTGIDIKEDDVKKLRKNVSFATTYEDSEVITYYRDALRGINLVTLLAPSVFFVVVLIVTALFLSQIVRQCRKDIGIMRALGESRASIALVFLNLGLFVGVIAWAIGIGIGSIFTVLANGAYGSAIKLFPQPFVLHPSAVFISLGIIVFVTVFTAFLASINIARIKPVEAMKALPPSSNETPLLTRTLFQSAPIPVKVTVSQALRNFRRYLLSGVCLLASGTLIFTALSIGESKNTMMTQLFSTRLNYDAQVYFDDMPSYEEAKLRLDQDDSNVRGATLIKYMPSQLSNPANGKKATALVNGIRTDQDLLRVVDEYQHVIDVPEEGIVLSSYHAYLLDVNVGDEILAEDTPLRVAAISTQCLYPVSYTHYDAYDTDYARGCLLVKVGDVDAFFKKYKDAEHFSYISYTSVIQGEFSDRLAAFSISSAILTAMAIVIGFMIVFNMMQTNLKEQKRTFATMRTLGYQRRSISMANLYVSLAQFVLAMCFAIPLGVFLSKGLLQSISIPSQIHPFPKTYTMYLYSTLIVLAFLLLSHVLVMRGMKRWNLPEEVKERE